MTRLRMYQLRKEDAKNVERQCKIDKGQCAFIIHRFNLLVISSGSFDAIHRFCLVINVAFACTHYVVTLTSSWNFNSFSVQIVQYSVSVVPSGLCRSRNFVNDIATSTYCLYTRIDTTDEDG